MSQDAYHNAITAVVADSLGFYEACGGELINWFNFIGLPPEYHAVFTGSNKGLSDIWSLKEADVERLLPSVNAAHSKTKWKDAMVLRFRRVDYSK